MHYGQVRFAPFIIIRGRKKERERVKGSSKKNVRVKNSFSQLFFHGPEKDLTASYRRVEH